MDAINASHRAAGADIDFGQFLRRNPARMLDDEAIHIHYPQCAIGAGSDLHRPKPIIGRGEKFRRFLVIGATSGECTVAWRQFHAMDDEIDRLTHESIARVILAEKIVSINAESASGGDVIGWTGQLEKLQ